MTQSTLSLYKHILRTAQRWPSIKKDRILDEIRDEFRRNQFEAEPQRVAKMLDEARAGLASLRQQCGLSDTNDISYAYEYERPSPNPGGTHQAHAHPLRPC